MRPDIELIHDPDCPNAELARTRLSQALAAAGLPVAWREWNRGRDIPPHARAYGSPTILVNARDVAGVSPAKGECCRIYQDQDGRLTGAPSVQAIGRALLEWRQRPEGCDALESAAAPSDGKAPVSPASGNPDHTSEETNNNHGWNEQ